MVRMKRMSCSVDHSFLASFEENEKDVAKILLQMPTFIFQSDFCHRFPLVWGVRRKRSAIDPTFSLPRLPSTSSPGLPGTFVAPISEDNGPVAKVEASSPATPLSFSPSESDHKSKRSKRNTSRKKKEHWLEMIDGLTQQGELLKREVENVQRYYNALKAFNSELKARKQELSGVRVEKGNPPLNVEMRLVPPRMDTENQSHLQNLMIFYRPPLFIQNPSAGGGGGGGGGVGVVNQMGPQGIPDLNLSPEEEYEETHSAALDLNLSMSMAANNQVMRRAAAARARKKRLQIYKVKKQPALALAQSIMN